MLDGNKIRELRNEMDKSLAEMGFSVGLSESMLRQIELGVKKPTIEGLKRIADYFGVTVDELYKVGV